jgi:hypothetical protein
MTDVERLESPLVIFWQFVKSVRSVPAWIVKASLAGPILNIVTKLGPTWPAVGGVSLLTAMIEVVALMLVFQFLGQRRLAIRRLEKWLLRLGIGLVVLLITYMCFFRFFTFNDPFTNQTKTKGFVLSSMVADALAGDKTRAIKDDLVWDIHGNLPESKLLKLGGYDSRFIWASWSVDIVEFLLLANWLAFFATFSAFTGLFVLLQQKKIGKKQHSQ